MRVSDFLKSRFPNQFSEFLLQMRWCRREDPLSEGYKRLQRRLLQVGSPPTAGKWGEWRVVGLAVTDRKFFADGNSSLQALVCPDLYIYLVLVIWMMFFKFHHKGEGTKLGWLSEIHKQLCKKCFILSAMVKLERSQLGKGCWVSWSSQPSDCPLKLLHKMAWSLCLPSKKFHPSVLRCLNWLECSGHGLVVLTRDLLRTPVFAGICICDVLWKIIQTIESFH